MTLTAGHRFSPRSRDIPADSQARASYVDQTVLFLGKQGLIPFENERGEILCSRCVQPLGKDDMKDGTAFCVSCNDFLDGILAANRSPRNPASVPAVS